MSRSPSPSASESSDYEVEENFHNAIADNADNLEFNLLPKALIIMNQEVDHPNIREEYKQKILTGITNLTSHVEIISAYARQITDPEAFDIEGDFDPEFKIKVLENLVNTQISCQRIMTFFLSRENADGGKNLELQELRQNCSDIADKARIDIGEYRVELVAAINNPAEAPAQNDLIRVAEMAEGERNANELVEQLEDLALAGKRKRGGDEVGGNPQDKRSREEKDKGPDGGPSPKAGSRSLVDNSKGSSK